MPPSPSPELRRAEVPLMPGAGTLTTRNALGHSVGAAPSFTAFPFQFRPAYNVQGLRLSYGVVDSREPTIKGKPMSETFLPLKAGEADELGRSWACIEVETTDGVITEKSRVELIHTGDKNYSTPEIGREPVTLILWDNERVVRVEHLLKFDVRYYRIQEGAKYMRHVFL